MKNTAKDLNNYLFEEMERLTDLDIENLNEDQIDLELDRAKAMCLVAASITANMGLVLKAKIAAREVFDQTDKLPELLEG